MENKAHGTTVLFLLIAPLCVTYGDNTNTQNTHVKFNITRTSKGDFVDANIPLQCHTFRSSCSDNLGSGNWNCYRCACMGSSTFQNYGIQVGLGTDLVPTGICTDGVQCGDGKHAMYLKSTQEDKALTAYNISEDTIDAIVESRGDFFMSPCSLAAATVIQDPVNKQVTRDFVIKSYNIMKNVYELSLEWNIPSHARQFYEGRLVLMSADCGRGKKPCFYVKFQGTENYERTLPTSKPPPVLSTVYQSTTNTSWFSRKETFTSPNATNATATAFTVVTNHTSNSSVYTTGSPRANATSAARTANTTVSTAVTNVTTPEISTTDRSHVTTTMSVTSTESTTLPKGTNSTTAEVVTAHVRTTLPLTTEEVTTTLTQSTVTTPAIYDHLKGKKSSVKHWLIVLSICVIIIAIIVAVGLVVWMYWKRKKRYCYNGAPIFTRLERTSLDSQRPDFLSKDENFGFVDLRAANDNAGAERGDTDSRDGLVNSGSREFDPDGEYQDFYTAVRDTRESNHGGQYAVANNNEYQSPVALPRIDPLQVTSSVAISSNRGGNGSINNYQPISEEMRSPSSTYQGLVPSQDHQYQSLKPNKDAKEYYAGLIAEPGSKDQNSPPVYAVLDYESVEDLNKQKPQS